MNKRRPVNVGGASLFAVLIILCLTIFAVLARLTAASELSLSEKAAQAQALYYEAECRAVVRAAEIQNNLYIYSIGEAIEFAEEIDENRELRVTLRITESGVIRDTWYVANKDTDKPDETPFHEGNFGVMIFD